MSGWTRRVRLESGAVMGEMLSRCAYARNRAARPGRSRTPATGAATARTAAASAPRLIAQQKARPRAMVHRWLFASATPPRDASTRTRPSPRAAVPQSIARGARARLARSNAHQGRRCAPPMERSETASRPAVTSARGSPHRLDARTARTPASRGPAAPNRATAPHAG